MVACLQHQPSLFLPIEARQFAAHFEAAELQAATAFAGIDLPGDLRSAVPKRQLQFRAGRFCALEALRTLDPGCSVKQIARGPSGAPRWPDGVTGSITHTENFAAAAVAWSVEAFALGIDSEPIMNDVRAQRVETTISSPAELSTAIAAGFTRLEALTLVFSAKETVFKCLHPRVGRMFGYHDVRIANVDRGARTFIAQVQTSLSRHFSSGAMLEGRLDFDDRQVHTGMLLRPRLHR
jgi:enterobactin synthetase component D